MKKINKPFSPYIFIGLLALVSGCGNWNIKTGESNISLSENGYVDQTNRDIIKSVIDAEGNSLDCTVGKSSSSRGLKTCNQIKKERLDQFKKKHQLRIKEDQKVSDKFLRKKISGSNIITFSSGLKVKINAQVKYSLETNEIIINSEVRRLKGNILDFNKVFISDESNLQISFLDKDRFELLKPLKLPLSIYKGQKEGIIYRKKFGRNPEDVVGIKILARKKLDKSIELERVSRLELSIKI
tara:strand:- start:226 stop:948 length:723 start_codon:yes stop_codon:yes gene_type:complete